MNLFDAYLEVKPSSLPGCGNGLFTTSFIPKGSYITEYQGKITSWKDADHDEGHNLYIYFVNRNHVIDASKNKKDFAHFANDASGKTKVKGIRNNSEYEVKGKKVYIVSTRDILPNQEVLVGYGQDYWDVIKKNGIL